MPAVDDLIGMEPEAQVAYVLERLRTASGSRSNGALLQRLARHTGMALEDIALAIVWLPTLSSRQDFENGVAGISIASRRRRRSRSSFVSNPVPSLPAKTRSD